MTRLDSDWITRQLEMLMSEADNIADVSPESTNEFRAMTILKLAAIAGIGDIFTKVAPKTFDHCYYIDALAGPGITKINESDEAVIGSPILTPEVAHNELSGYEFIDLNGKFTEALDARLQYYQEHVNKEYPYDKVKIHTANCNEKVPDIIDGIREKHPGFRGVNILSVFDNQGLEARWETVEKLADLYGDLLITFNVVRVSRNRGRWEKQDNIERKRENNEFFGTEDWMQCENEDELIQLYRDRLENEPRQDRITKKITVESGSGGGRFYYVLIYCTRNTEGATPYLEAIDHIKNQVEDLDGDSVQDIIKVFRGDQAALDSF